MGSARLECQSKCRYDRSPASGRRAHARLTMVALNEAE
jgi:hypothetical protein